MSKILELREKRAKAWEAAKAFLQLFHGCRFSSFELDNSGCLIK